jgi:C4-dicarboxylate-specific signal transduction histidine kinase
VDTHLLRELGTLLVGRDSTALVELIKNAYDADARIVTIHGESLANHGLISVRDDGHGMTYENFSESFLRIAGRSKEGGDRRSPRYRRKYTGAKGIGRLAAHKLGERLALESTPDNTVLGRPAEANGVAANINWVEIEASEKSIDETKLVQATRTPPVPGESGTELTISRLHSDWSTRQLNEFLAEVRSTRPDEVMWGTLPKTVFEEPLLLPTLDIADSDSEDPGFTVELSGEFAGSESQWPTLLAHIAWIIEVDARDEEVVSYRITPSRSLKKQHPGAEQRDFTWRRAQPGPRFAARVLVRGTDSFPRALKDLLTTFANAASGIRLYSEGFRVLPYGTSRNDWLGIDRAYSAREELGLGADFDRELPSADNRETKVQEKTYRLSNRSYFGAVFLHDESSANLQMVVNREGFLPNDDFDQIVDIMSRAVSINARMRAALGVQKKERDEAEEAAVAAAQREEVLNRAKHPESRTSTTPRTAAQELRTLLEVGRDSVAALRVAGGSTSPPEGRDVHARVLQVVLDEIGSASLAAADEQAQLRVLASLGTQLGAFVHEVNSLLGQARLVESALGDLLELDLPSEARARIQRIRRAQIELLSTLERQAVYLSDSFGAESRRRRSRQRLSERWETAQRLLSAAAQRRDITISDSLPSGLRTPPMFSAEANIILTNLLSNAVKAAASGDVSEERQIKLTGTESDGGVLLRMENTGARVDMSNSDRWFRPFETTTSDMDETLGQGLGLGLTLTRRIVEDYGGRIAFVEPSAGMATAVEIWLPES